MEDEIRGKGAAALAVKEKAAASVVNKEGNGTMDEEAAAPPVAGVGALADEEGMTTMDEEGAPAPLGIRVGTLGRWDGSAPGEEDSPASVDVGQWQCRRLLLLVGTAVGLVAALASRRLQRATGTSSGTVAMMGADRHRGFPRQVVVMRLECWADGPDSIYNGL
ncbi:hypothetical protein OPV22_010417 [Ensete ventricosum]|uniref:Uncharacterized protein n=1 Tax=Ensete ventricosum TaxID=4639 RepID=A0AAV8Q2G6_ENSVE|nr:hypothetical protein OPV22_010417 [Ensete ventricosum]